MKMDAEEFKDDELDIQEPWMPPKQTKNSQKQVITTQKENKNLKFSENEHVADIQQRLLRVEYELLFIRDKLFEESKNSKIPKISAYGKLIKRRING